jgi:hypothetical protein
VNPQQFADLRSRITQLKDSADMALAAIAMLERNVRELVQQLHVVNKMAQGEK